MRLPHHHDLAEAPARKRPTLRVVEAATASMPEPHTRTSVPIAVWPCAQQTSQVQRHGRYLPESNRHPAKMLPELARRAISAYSEPGQLVLDPMCGIGTTLVEAIHLGREAVGVELEPRWVAVSAANLALARRQGASGRGQAGQGDARLLGRGQLEQLADHASLELRERLVALLCALRDERLVPRPSFFQLQRQRIGSTPRMLLIAHEDVLVFTRRHRGPGR